MLQAEQAEFQAIIARRSASTWEHEHQFGSFAVSTKMTWWEKIILVLEKAKRPLLAREIGPVLCNGSRTPCHPTPETIRTPST